MASVRSEIGSATGRVSGDRMSLLTKVARLYHEQGVRQPEIATRLSISQSRVSRLLKEAGTIGVVRTIVVPPVDVHPDLEDAIQTRYGLRDVIVADTGDDDEASVRAGLGGAGAAYLETTLGAQDRVGVSSWSSSLLATVDATRPRPTRSADSIIQVIGGVGDSSTHMRSTHLVERLAGATGATPVYLPAPGLVSSRSARDALLNDDAIASVAASWSSLTVLLTGIGSMQRPHPVAAGGELLRQEVERLRDTGAVGDVCLRFFDAEGRLVDGVLSDRIVGIGAEQLRAVPRKVAIAGGADKLAAIVGAMRGGWIDVLITDLTTARALAAE